VLVAGVMALGYLTYRRRHRFLALKGDFVSAVSHELRTPLASIRLMAETLERRTRDVPGVRDYPARIVRDIDGLGFLVENILSFNRLSRGKWKPQRESVRLGDVVARLAAERDLWARRAAELTGDDLDRVVLRADRDLLKLLLTNLLRNACSYNERDPARVRLSAVPRPAGGWIVRVGDNGVGIPTAEHERIFDDFYRAREGSERGSGLGLAICRKVMEAHGGSVRVAESSPAGTTFELCFPG
jgi:signal transduction histidine kinase